MISVLNAIAVVALALLGINLFLRLLKNVFNLRFERDDEYGQVLNPSSRLRLLCVLGKDRNGVHVFQPVATMHPMPPRASVQGQWALPPDSGFILRETHATHAAPSVLARYLRQRQTNAVCPSASSFGLLGAHHA